MGMIYREGTYYGGGNGDNSVEISYEEYQKLSEEEKAKDITYFISDYPGVVNLADIVDNLESTDPNKALSANMGRQLKEDIENKLEVIDYSSQMTSDYFDLSKLYLKKSGNIVVLNGSISPLSGVSIPNGKATYGAIFIPNECSTGINTVSQYAPQVNINNTILFQVGGNNDVVVYVYGSTAYSVGSYAVNLTWMV